MTEKLATQSWPFTRPANLPVIFGVLCLAVVPFSVSVDASSIELDSVSDPTNSIRNISIANQGCSDTFHSDHLQHHLYYQVHSPHPSQCHQVPPPHQLHHRLHQYYAAIHSRQLKESNRLQIILTIVIQHGTSAFLHQSDIHQPALMSQCAHVSITIQLYQPTWLACRSNGVLHLYTYRSFPFNSDVR